MMVLRPLEFADCLSDSPWFRQNLHEHEIVLEDAHKNIKNIESQCRELINCTRKLSIAQRAFARSLKDFKFISIGSTQTDDERKIAECLSKFGDFINQIEDHREKIVQDSDAHILEPLKRFRVDAIGKVLHEDKKKYEKESNKFYASLEKHLHLSTTRKNDFKEADAQLDMQQRNFCKCSLDYVTAIQSVQERMRFEFVETLSTFLYSWLTFYHVGHVTHEDFKPFLSEVQSKVQKAKQSFDETKECYDTLKKKMLATHLKNTIFQSDTSKDSQSAENAPPRSPSSIKQGYVFVQEKSKIPKTIGRDVLSNRWTMYYCVYQKETRIFTMIPVNNTAKTDMKGALGQSVSFKLKSCTRRASDSIDKRFCFDISAIDRPESITVQALCEEDRRQWLDAMDGREPIYSPGTGPPTNNFGILPKERSSSWGALTAAPDSSSGASPYNLACGLRAVYQGSAFLPAFVVEGCHAMLDEEGFEFVRKCIETIEEKGLREQGLYRNCGVTSKVQKLMQVGLDKRRATSNEKLNFIDDVEWETKTVSSAIKTFLRNLPEPLMTFDLHSQFINAAKMDSATRVSHIHYYVHQLPKTHFDMLRLVIEHLKKVADRSSDNLMTVGNLGVCFGPTLLRPKEETMAAIMDIKFCNVVVEVLIANCDLIFNTQPSNIDGVPCPPKPVHRNDSNVVAEGISSSPSAVPFLDVVPSSFHKQSSVSPSADKRLHADGSSSSSLPGVVAGGNRPRSIGNSTARQRPPHIYDRVATSFIDSQSDANLNSPPRLLPSYGKASTSAGASPVSPTASTVALSISQSAVASSTVPKSHYAMKRATNSQISAGGNGRQRSAQYYHHQQQDTRTESSDSLNSVASGCSVDASPPLSSTRHQLSMDTGSALLSSREPRAAGGSASSASKAKMSASYAPAYNPFACESINDRLNKRHSGRNRLMSQSVIVDSSSNNKNKNKNLGYLGISSAFTATPNERLNGGSSSKKYSRNASSPATTGTAVSPHRSLNSINSTNHPCSQNVMMALNELRISPLFSYSHPLRSLQPSRRVKTLYSCTAGHDTELSFKPGQIITNVYESKEEGWLVGTLNGKTGLIPANYVEPLP